MAVEFTKYDEYGDIHWRETNPLGLRYNPALMSRYRSVLKHMPSTAKKVLDIGCGDGRLSHLIAEKLPRSSVFGIDTEPRGIEIAKQRAALATHNNVDFILHRSDTLDFADATFNLVIMTDVIEHLPDTNTMMSEIARVLTSDGHAVITTPNRQEGSKWDIRHVLEFDGHELKLLMGKHFQETTVYGSWPMPLFRSGKKLHGRLLLNLTSRIGIDLLGRETIDPTSEYGQLLAVCKFPKKVFVD